MWDAQASDRFACDPRRACDRSRSIRSVNTMSNQSATSSASLPLAAATPERNSLGRTLAGWLQARHMSHLGIANTMRLAGISNRIRFRRQDRWRRELYRNELTTLFEENGALTRP